MSFSIVPEPSNIDRYGMRALLTIGDWTETVFLRIAYWNLDQYLEHWKTEIGKILSGEIRKSVLFVEMKDPKRCRKTMEGWPLWRVGERVYFNNIHFSMACCRDRFDLDDPGKLLDDFEPDKSKRTAQEWTCTIGDLADWLAKQK